MLITVSADAASEPLPIDADEWADFSVMDPQLFPDTTTSASADEPVSRVIPFAPAAEADPAVNLIPLPTPVIPAVLGLSALALRFVLRGRRSATAGVFRRSR